MNTHDQDNSFIKLKAFLQISRANLLLASIGHATLGLLLAAGSLFNLFQIEVPLYIILHYIIALFGCNINSYFDYEVDKLYKKYMADSVDVLGQSMVRVLIIVEALFACCLILLFFWLGFWIVSLLALIGFLGAFFYSAKPVRIKKYGLLSPIPVLILYTFPLFGGWFLFQNNLQPVFVFFVFGYMLMNEGFTLVNTCEDYSEDKMKGIMTWAHVFGLKKTLHLAFYFSLGGFLCILSLVILLFDNGFRGTLSDWLTVVMIMISAVLIGKASLEVREVYLSNDLELQAKRYGVRLQRWFMMTRYPLMMTALTLLVIF